MYIIPIIHMLLCFHGHSLLPALSEILHWVFYLNIMPSLLQLRFLVTTTSLTHTFHLPLYYLKYFNFLPPYMVLPTLYSDPSAWARA